mmetsp:Transcript_20610/g.24748  ORF Transcript_20610/g.24748 Transcript_20610/m.24748 type:complete len:637 (-) Transcript_20610:656-2566(-)|eukprot:CAMPEP_0197855374 /NCGR_PEP_ID=MMETSP1438-20131217/26515_1 /TAXON_ID=1461541 /ORGANISM="Pterosperma sp., Strain CCMP1384" /LENGTH=636 /DNA_ID=CAMNT_0043470457 /DNA_START=127 /DNA_END=2037 /DNA_ORIENTATION=+
MTSVETDDLGRVSDHEPPRKRSRRAQQIVPDIPERPLKMMTNGASNAEHSESKVGKGESVAEYIGPNRSINHEEFVRLLGQALSGLGYDSAAKVLEEESGIQVQSETVNNFRQHILEGDWKNVVDAIDALPLGDPQIQKAALFQIYEQKYLEALEQGDLPCALSTLRKQLRPLTANIKMRQHRLHQLSSYLMCDSAANLMSQANWSGAAHGSRFDLLLQLQNLLPPSVMLPERRLEVLVDQALQCQIRACRFHNTKDPHVSLLSDHVCTINEIPTITTQVLEDHTDEVWYLQFSHNGEYLASASKDNTAIIWKVNEDGTIDKWHTLIGHTDAPAFVSWCPDDTMILTCGNDNMINLWDVETGNRLKLFCKHSAPVTACAWMPDGTKFVSGSVDKYMYMWDIDGNELNHWSGNRINDLVITSDGRNLITVDQEKKIRIYNFEMEDATELTETSSVTSISISHDGRFLLANLSCQTIHLWDLGHRDLVSSCFQEDMRIAEMCKEYKFRSPSQKQGRFVIRSCFGGSSHSYIVSGSEDSRVYIWHLDGELLEVLPGHSGTVNSVSWNPTNPYMFASASDDNTIRVWGTHSTNATIQAAISASTSTDPTSSTPQEDADQDSIQEQPHASDQPLPPNGSVS